MNWKSLVVGASSVFAMLGVMAWSAPAQAQIHNDHYAGYQVKSKLPKGMAGTISNQVEPAGTFAKCKLKFLLVPTLKNGGGTVTNPNAHYCCWQCKGGKPPVPYTITDQFAAGGVTTKKLKMICNLCTKS